MRKKFSEILRLALENKHIKPNVGSSSAHAKDKSYFYITDKENVDGTDNKIRIHRIDMEKDFFEVNVDTKNSLNEDIEYHGNLMVKSYTKDYSVLHFYPKNTIKFMKNNKLTDINKFKETNLKINDDLDYTTSDLEIVGLGSDGVIVKSNDLKKGYDTVKEIEKLCKDILAKKK